MAGKEIVLSLLPEIRALHAHLNPLVICFAAPQDRVDGLEEFSHSIISLWPRAVEPSHVTVRPRDESVCAHRNRHHDLSALLHDSSPPPECWLIYRYASTRTE